MFAGTSGIPNTHQYTGKEEESLTEQYYYGARYYSPTLGRFLSTDPAGIEITNPQSWNRYAYVQNNPFKYVDPDGRVLETAWDAFNITLGVYSLKQNLSNGNYIDAIIDAGGIAIDTTAAIIPIVPGGAGTIIKASRVSTKSEEAVKLFRAVSKAELDDIKRFGGFRLKPGTYEQKLLATTPEDAARFGRNNFGLDKEPFDIIEVEVPKSIADDFLRLPLDNMPAVAVPKESLDVLNRSSNIRQLNRLPVN